MRACNRREFLRESVAGIAHGGALVASLRAAGAAAGGALMGGGAGCSESAAPEGVPLGPLADIPEGDTPFTTLRLLVRRRGTVLQAMSLVCTHQTCLVAQDADGFRCPCHGSLFGPDGQVRRGPALFPLKHIKLALNESRGVVAYPTEQVAADWKLEIGPA